jgi:putative ABC transport system substrate-binding protein
VILSGKRRNGSHGECQSAAHRQMGVYAGRILKGRKACQPADLAVDCVRVCDQLSTARALGIEVPPTLSARADEVIE